MEGEPQTSGLEDGQQNLNDLQNYLVHFNKEIEVTGETAFQHNVSQILTQSVQPVFVSVPVSSETSTPDEEQLPVISEIKGNVCKTVADTLIVDALQASPGGPSLNDNVSILEMSPEVAKDTEGQLVSVDSSLEGLSQGTMRLQEISPEQVLAQGHLGFTVSDGMLVLPMGDAGNVLSQNDPHLVQLVNINGQPALHIVNDPSASLRPQTATTGIQLSQTVTTASMRMMTPASGQTGVIDTTDPVSVLASVAANTNNVNQLSSIQASPQDVNGAQLVALRNSADGSQPQFVAVQMDENNTVSTGTSSVVGSSGEGLQLNSPVVLNTGTGYQSVAIMASGEGGQSGEVNYVLIVNQNQENNKEALQTPVYDLGDDLRGEVIQELTDDGSSVKRLVKINQILGKRSADNIHAIPVGDQLMCSYCNYTSHKRYLLSRHMKSHSEERPHKCGLCLRGFKTLASLQNHINTHTGTRPHKCKLCESAFTTSGELVRHIRYKHTFEKPHKCTECDYASVELSKLKRHMRSHTGERPYACTHCNYASPDTYKLKRHMRIHTGEKPYECDVCHAKFTQSNSLKAHKLIHTGNKPVFQCSLCPATCGRKNDLRIHMLKLHTSDHPLQCKKCRQSFPDRYTYKMHAKSHEGEKCYKCSECQYAATCHRHLMTHMLTHSNSKPFECEDCNLAFRQKQLLKRHRNLYHHAENTSPEDSKEKDEDQEQECQACIKAFVNKDNVNPARPDIANNMDRDTNDGAEKDEDFHTCGGAPKAALEALVPLTADQLIENSLLADMKEGKLGVSPKVVVVHPDGRVEEVTAKLQSLSQSKPMDDFLVSLGVTGDAQFDQDTGLNTVDLEVTSNSTVLVPPTTDDTHTANHNTVECIIKDEPEVYDLNSVAHGMGIDQTKEESTQASFDSDDEESKKLKMLGQEQLLRLAQGDNDESVDSEDFVHFKVIPDDKSLDPSAHQMIANFFQTEENKHDKRSLEDVTLPQEKRLKMSQDFMNSTNS